MILGSQFFVAGFLGELILRSKKDTKKLYHQREYLTTKIVKTYN